MTIAIPAVLLSLLTAAGSAQRPASRRPAADAAPKGPAGLEALLSLRARAASPDDTGVEAATDALLQTTNSALVLAHLPYRRREQVQTAEARLVALTADPANYESIAVSLEVLARTHRRLHELGNESLEFLGRAVSRSLPNMKPGDHSTPRFALAALSAAGRADERVIRTGLRDRDAQVRRTAMDALNSAGASVDAAARTELVRAAFEDESLFVRYEAVRGWAQRETAAHGCGPLLAAIGDRSLHVALAAIDALGERCGEDEAITARLVTEASTPPNIGDWHREAHAFVALARRSPERAAMSMTAFKSHIVWQVRMYAARAAAAMKDVPTLEKLAYDDHDNVREAALGPLRTLKGSESDAAFIAALARADYQLLRTAALALKDAAPDKYLLAALADALRRVTADRKETSRDTRLALLERIRAMGGRDQRSLYERLLTDFDPQVAAAAAEACAALSTRACDADPQRLPRPPPPTRGELGEGLKAVVRLDNGRSFALEFDRGLAPEACARFLRLARAHYYDGLTFHRVVPNFVIQGGSPGANEYVGDGPFMRDELGGSHRRGTVGISTRGRDTGDAQIFVNLVDNPRLDLEYTVFARISDVDMATVDTIQEGARITRIQLVRDRP